MWIYSMTVITFAADKNCFFCLVNSWGGLV
jgi:hypothetical protein